MSTNDPMTQERLDAIQERVDKATLGPWSNDYGGNVDQVDPDGARIADNLTQADAEFIAHARQDVPALLAEVERLRALTTVDDAMVERAALAFYEYPTPGVDVSLTPGWDRLAVVSPDIAAVYRNCIRAALDAAHNPGMWS